MLSPNDAQLLGELEGGIVMLKSLPLVGDVPSSASKADPFDLTIVLVPFNDAF